MNSSTDILVSHFSSPYFSMRLIHCVAIMIERCDCVLIVCKCVSLLRGHSLKMILWVLWWLWWWCWCVCMCVCVWGGWLTIHKICKGYPIKASTTRCVSISHLMTLLYITELQPILFVDCIVAIILHKSAWQTYFFEKGKIIGWKYDGFQQPSGYRFVWRRIILIYSMN